MKLFVNSLNNRLDFMDFELVQPNRGDCDTDFFTVNGQNLNSVVPKICGFNSGQHCMLYLFNTINLFTILIQKVYVDVDGVQGPINLNVRTNGPGNRRWNLLVSQIECNNPSKGLNLTDNNP